MQELIAPDIVQFFSKDWVRCGHRAELARTLYQATNIDEEILRRPPETLTPAWLSEFSIAKRMSWAAKRETTRPEDVAYCLLGLFDVSMGMFYGEGGPKAFHRLQEEIMRYSTDQTILAWSPDADNPSEVMSVLADSPSAFRDGSRILAIPQDEPFEMTNKGLRIPPRLYDPSEELSIQTMLPSGTKVAVLSCIYADDARGQLGIALVQPSETTQGSESPFFRIVQRPEIVPVKEIRADSNAKFAKDAKLLLELERELSRYLDWGNFNPRLGSPTSRLEDVQRELARGAVQVNTNFNAIVQYLIEDKRPKLENIYIAHKIHGIPKTLKVGEDEVCFWLLRTEWSDPSFKRRFSLEWPGSTQWEQATGVFRIPKDDIPLHKSITIYLTEREEEIGPHLAVCVIFLSLVDSGSWRLEIFDPCRDRRTTGSERGHQVEWKSGDHGLKLRANIKKEWISGRFFEIIDIDVQIRHRRRGAEPDPPDQQDNRRRSILGKLWKKSV